MASIIERAKQRVSLFFQPAKETIKEIFTGKVEAPKTIKPGTTFTPSEIPVSLGGTQQPSPRGADIRSGAPTLTTEGKLVSTGELPPILSEQQLQKQTQQISKVDIPKDIPKQTITDRVKQFTQQQFALDQRKELRIEPDKPLTIRERYEQQKIKFDLWRERRSKKRGELTKGEEAEIKRLEAGLREKSFTPTGKGTIVQEFIPYTEKEIVELAEEGKISGKVAVIELGRREGEKYGREYTTNINLIASGIKKEGEKKFNEEVEKSKQNINDLRYGLQLEVNKGNITSAEANTEMKKSVQEERKKLQKYIITLNDEQRKKLESGAKGWVETRGKSLEKSSEIYLDKVGDKIQFSRTVANIPLYITAGIVTGGISTVVTGTGGVVAGIVKGVGYTAGGIAIASASYSLGRSYAQGTLTGNEVANIVIPFVAFGVGARIGAKITTTAQVQENIGKQARLKGAIERSEIESKILKGISNEKQIIRLQIPEYQKLQLIAQLKTGGSIKIIKSKINPANELDGGIINKEMPFRDIKFLVVTDQAGNVVNSVSLGRIYVGKGKYLFREDIISGAVGKISKRGIITMERLTFSGVEGKYLTRAIKTAEIIKPKVITKAKLREITGRAITIKAKEIYKKKGITYKDLAEVFKSQYKRISAKTKFTESQQLLKTEQLIAQSKKELILAQKKVFATAVGKSITEPVVKPVLYKLSKAMKPFIDIKDVKKIITQKSPLALKKLITTKIKAVQYPKVELPTPDLSASIKGALKSAGETLSTDIVFGATRFTGYGLGGGRIPDIIGGKIGDLGFIEGRIPTGVLDKDLENIKKGLRKRVKVTGKTGLIYGDLLKKSGKRRGYMERGIETVNVRIDELNKQVEKQIQSISPKLKIKQQQRLRQKFIQIPKIDFTIPTIIIPKPPKITFPLIPKPSKKPITNFQKSLKKSQKQARKITSAYTSSLGAAAFDVRVKAPRSRAKEIIKKLKESKLTGLEFRPQIEFVDDEEDKELRKKIKKAVQF